MHNFVKSQTVKPQTAQLIDSKTIETTETNENTDITENTEDENIRPGEHEELEEQREQEKQTGQKEQKDQKEQKKENNPRKRIFEKPSTYNAKGQRYAFLLLGILCLALILSLFIGEKPTLSSSASNVSPVSAYQDHTPTFADQLKREQQYSVSESNEQKNMWIHQMKRPDSTIPRDWQKQESVRVLNSRKVAFHFNFSNKQNSDLDITPNRIQVNPTQTNPVGKDNLSPTIEEVKNMQSQKIKDKGLIPTGTVISAILDQDVNSDYIGQWLGHVTHDVYNTDQTFVLIPKGTKLTGKTLHIGNINTPIQNCLGLTVEWAILPNGQRIDFRKADVEDQTGIHAIKDKVNRHLGWQLGGVAAYALLSSNTPQPNYYGQPEQMTFMDQFQIGLEQQAKPMINKYLSLVPTVIIQTGTPIKILVKDDLSVPIWSRVNRTVYR